ncbi:50S ribosomal protein L18 [Aquirufa ecclesiirivi]|uniref:Large ribosomal subunit protein uL18 n=1 Tax=Aquirufa ecclesiirivi TaxID=2715124 RepID=A0ABT4JFZ2_9BACT|nr:50S ribosomal protein L18 [Aquirufa ecclesiirivi]MCZ2473404.1 50S ribosomal protein L18 [Aquirufa ecclesiirivi]MCZ2475187.1 50S ribosomal protein L18 [Aquirufa ecclesiirivi]MDF0692396.1 50S ribosomal protein L18 [Aquirufa ecclesiirivi]NHC48221.1 50S ribosomal protein L18 [Aquirufa ecclesiirivi]
MATTKDLRRLRIKRAIRAKIKGTAERPRLTVFRSNTAMYAQLVDDLSGKTMMSATSYKKGKVNNNVEAAKLVGTAIADKAKAAGITKVVFDRNGYLYHGRIKSLAEGAREGGLQF